ncbi:MAG: type II secretion system inner membrane protein GspF [Bdellovibrio sp.]|jgi:general secretion pathway protein F
MPIFEYRGLTKAGKNTSGVVDAENLRAARMKIKKDGVFVVDIRDKKKSSPGGGKKKATGGKSVGVKDISLMTRQLATLIKANIPLVDALTAVAEQVENPVLSEAISDCKNMVNEGSPLHKALGKYPNIFNNIYVSMCEAGEMSGTLDVILMRLAEFTESQNELRTKVKGALTYPIVMLVVTLGLLVFLFVFVIPKIVTVFENAPNLKLPWLTEVIIALSGVLVNYWYVLIGLSFLVWLIFTNWKKTPAGKTQWDLISLKLPLFGEMNRMVAVSRFTRTLATLLTGGVPMLHALQIVRNVVDNDIIAKAVDEARSNISEGEGIAGPLKRSGQFPPIVIHMVTIGEKTGELENMLLQVSDAFEFQVKSKIETMTSLMGPVVLIVMGLAVGIIVFAVMVPMFEITNIAG